MVRLCDILLTFESVGLFRSRDSQFVDYSSRFNIQNCVRQCVCVRDVCGCEWMHERQTERERGREREREREREPERERARGRVHARLPSHQEVQQNRVCCTNLIEKHTVLCAVTREKDVSDAKRENSR